MNRLEAVNYVLSRAGRGEISALHTGLASDAANAERELNRASISIQKIGWHANTYEDIELTPDANDEIHVPTGTLWIDTDKEDAYRNITQIGNRLYDHDEDRYTFPDTDTLKCRYVSVWEIECIPYPIREYIVIQASFNFVTQYGSRFMAPSELAMIRSQLFGELNQARIDAKRFDANTSNVNILDTPHVRDIKGQRNSGMQGRGGGFAYKP